MNNETDRTTGAENAASGAGEHGFRNPARVRKPIYIAAGAVFLIVAALVYMMARPDPERLARGYVEAALSALPERGMDQGDVRTARMNLDRALDAMPGFPLAQEAIGRARQQVARHIDKDIQGRQLDSAGELLDAANAAWPDSEEFDIASDLREKLRQAQEAQRLSQEIREILAEIKRRAGSEMDESTEAMRNVLRQLTLALEALPTSEQAPGLRADLSRDMADAVRSSIDSDKLERAQQLIDAVPSDWSMDAEITDLQEEVKGRLRAANQASQVRELLDQAQESIAADRLTMPVGNNAVGYLRQALALDPGNEAAARGMEMVADRYAQMIGNALNQGSLASASRFIASLEGVAPSDPRLAGFAERIEAIESTQAAAQQSAPPRGRAPEPEESEPAPSDPEGQLWYAVRNSCEEKELRRYINTYPSGRYSDDAWERISACLAEAQTEN